MEEETRETAMQRSNRAYVPSVARGRGMAYLPQWGWLDPPGWWVCHESHLFGDRTRAYRLVEPERR